MPRLPWATWKDSGDTVKPEYASLGDGDDRESSFGAKPEHAAWDNSQRQRPRWLSVYLAIINSVVVVLMVAVVSQLLPAAKPSNPYGVPDFPRAVIAFHEDPAYMARPSPDSDLLWDRLGGPDPVDGQHHHRGFIKLKGDHLAKSQKVKGSDEMIYGVSMLHQLHCLGGIRKMYWDLVYSRADPATLLAQSPDVPWANQTFDGLTNGLWHVSHCFDILRQALLCSADMSLEWPMKLGDKGDIVVGWENPHQCKDQKAVWGWIEEHSGVMT